MRLTAIPCRSVIELLESLRAVLGRLLVLSITLHSRHFRAPRLEGLLDRRVLEPHGLSCTASRSLLATLLKGRSSHPEHLTYWIDACLESSKVVQDLAAAVSSHANTAGGPTSS